MIILRGPYSESERRIAERAYDSGFKQAEEESDGFSGVSGWTNRNPFRDTREPEQALGEDLIEAMTRPLTDLVDPDSVVYTVN